MKTLSKCETCLWTYLKQEDDEDFDCEYCDFYCPIEDEEALEKEYIEKRYSEFCKEWDLYIENWN